MTTQDIANRMLYVNNRKMVRKVFVVVFRNQLGYYNTWEVDAYTKYEAKNKFKDILKGVEVIEVVETNEVVA